jgi:HK97 family phage major capsid protein
MSVENGIEIKQETDKLDQIIALTLKTQERQDEIGKKEAEKDLAIKQLGEKIIALTEAKEKEEAEKKAASKRIDDLEAELKRAPLGKSDSKEDSAISNFKSAFAEYARRKGNEINPEIIKEYNTSFINKFAAHEKAEVRESLVKTLSVDSNPDGGYLVLPERDPNVRNIRDFETSPVRSVANIITTANESYQMVIDDDESTSGGWVSEQQSRADTATPQFGEITIATHEQFAQPKVTQKLLDDASINIESYLSQKTNEIITRTENTAFVTGNGGGKPKGFLSYDAWASAGVYERGKIEQIDSTSSANFVADSIKTLQNSLKGIYQPNAVFMLKRAEWAKIITLKDGEGNYLLDPRSFKAGDTLTLLGKPVIFADDMPTAAADSLSMVYGDFRAGYTIVDRLGIRVLRDNLTDKPYIKFYTTKRVGGAVTNYEALKIYKLAA